MRKSTIGAVTAAFALMAAPAFAADNGLYLGAAVGQSGVSFDETIEG